MSGSRALGTSLLRQLPSPLGFLPLALLLAAWEVLQRGPSPYFPRPSIWWAGMLELARTGALGTAVITTLDTLLVGLTAAVLSGALIGLLIGLSRTASRSLSPLLEFLRAVPPPAVVPLVILLLGYDDGMKIFVVTFSALWPVLLNVAGAVARIHPLLFDVAHSFHLRAPTRLRVIVLPSIAPALFVGIRVALPLAIVVTLLVEILTSIGGLGALMIAAQRNFKAGQVYGLLILIGLIGFALNCVLVASETFVLRHWPPSGRASD